MEWDRRWLSLGGELTFEKMQFRTPSGLCRPLTGAKSPSPNRPVKRDFRFPENEFWNLPLEMAFLFGDRVFGRMSGQNGCNVDSLGVFGRFRGLPTAFIHSVSKLIQFQIVYLRGREFWKKPRKTIPLFKTT